MLSSDSIVDLARMVFWKIKILPKQSFIKIIHQFTWYPQWVDAAPFYNLTTKQTSWYDKDNTISHDFKGF